GYCLTARVVLPQGAIQAYGELPSVTVCDIDAVRRDFVRRRHVSSHTDCLTRSSKRNLSKLNTWRQSHAHRDANLDGRRRRRGGESSHRPAGGPENRLLVYASARW